MNILEKRYHKKFLVCSMNKITLVVFGEPLSFKRILSDFLGVKKMLPILSLTCIGHSGPPSASNGGRARLDFVRR